MAVPSQNQIRLEQTSRRYPWFDLGGTTILSGLPEHVTRSCAVALRRAAVTVAWLACFAAPASGQIDPSRSLLLEWTATGDDGYSGRVSSYEVRHHVAPPQGADDASLQAWWDDVPASQRTLWSDNLAAAGNVESRRVTGLAPSTTYYFVIRARDEAGNVSDFSNVAQGATAVACAAPSAAPGSFAAVPDDGAVHASWNETEDPAVRSLRLYRSAGSSGSWVLIHEAAPAATQHVDRSVQPGRTYRYRATWTGDGCEGPFTAVRTVTLPGSAPSAAAGGEPRIRAYPNPSTGPVTLEIVVSGSTAQNARVRLYDMKGRWIAELASGVYPPGASTLTWNRTSRTGEMVGAGYYELIGVIGDEKVHEALVLLP